MEQIDPRHLLAGVAKILNRLKIPYLVTGGMAVFVWGRPRFTADIDIVVELKSKDIDNFSFELLALSEASYLDKNMIEDAIKRKSEFNFIDGKSGIKVDFWVLEENSFNTSRLQRRVKKEIAGEQVYFTSKEDLIVSKLLWYKESQSSRHLEDIVSIFKISQVDIEYIRDWAKKQTTIETFNDLYKKI